MEEKLVIFIKKDLTATWLGAMMHISETRVSDCCKF